MLTGIKFRIYPNREQLNNINRTLGCCRWIYNHELERKSALYRSDGKTVTYRESSATLTQLKRDSETAWLNDADSTGLQQSLRDLFKGFDNFFSGNAKYPVFKKKSDSFQSYRTEKVGNNIRIIDSRHVRLPKLGIVKAKSIRLTGGIIKHATIEKYSTGKYFCSLCVEVHDVRLQNEGAETGIDVGIKEFLTMSDGTIIHNPKFLKTLEKKLGREQKKLSRMIESHITGYKTVGGKRYPVFDKPIRECRNIQKQRRRIALIHEKIANRRHDFLHKLSTRLCKENQLICCEDLNVKGMVRNRHLAKSISDVSWSMFFKMLEYKAAKYGTVLVKVPRFFASSQICSCCGYKNVQVKDLSVRIWTCPKCGVTHDRDHNSAVNVLAEGKRVSSAS